MAFCDHLRPLKRHQPFTSLFMVIYKVTWFGGSFLPSKYTFIRQRFLKKILGKKTFWEKKRLWWSITFSPEGFAKGCSLEPPEVLPATTSPSAISQQDGSSITSITTVRGPVRMRSLTVR